MSERHVWIAITAYAGTIHIQTFVWIMESMLALAAKGIRVTPIAETGNAMIAHGRDLLCAKFLGSDATDLVFVDHDVTGNADVFVRLVEHPVDVVAGIYPVRSDPPNFMVRHVEGRKELQAVNPQTGEPAEFGTGLLEVEGVPAGFLRITRNCLEKMVLAYPELRFADQHAPKGYGWSLFDNIHEGDAYFGEDYSFCRRWRQIGGKVWCDPEMELGHIGYKRFIGTYGDWLRAKISPEA